MIKLLGIGLFLFGTVLLVVAILQGKKESIRDVTEELSLIVGSGYAVSHKEAKANPSPESIGRDLPAIKAAPKKRALSKEAEEILAMVEKEKRADKRSESKETEDKTDLISKGESEPAKNDRTDLLQSMKERPAKKKKASGGTDVLEQRKSPESQGRTDLLVNQGRVYSEKTAGKRESNRNNKDSTDILGNGNSRDKTDVMKRTKTNDKTDILVRHPSEQEKIMLKKEQKQHDSTDVLVRGKKGDGQKTDILADRSTGRNSQQTERSEN